MRHFPKYLFCRTTVYDCFWRYLRKQIWFKGVFRIQYNIYEKAFSAKIVNGFQLLTTFAKSSIKDVQLDSYYVFIILGAEILTDARRGIIKVFLDETNLHSNIQRNSNNVNSIVVRTCSWVNILSEIGVLKNFTNSTGKHQSWSLC